MPFIGELVVKQLPVKTIKKRFLKIFPYKKKVLEWEVYEPLSYQDDKLRLKVTVPKGSKTDFASIPRIFWPILPPAGRYSKAAVVHDYCYRHGLFTREISDLIFLHAMEELDVAKWKRFVMFWAVRLFGKHSYRKRRNDSAPTTRN